MFSLVGPRVRTDALEGTPQLLAVGPILAGVRDARRLAVLYDLAEMNGHVTVDVQDFFIDDKTSKAADQSLMYGREHVE